MHAGDGVERVGYYSVTSFISRAPRWFRQAHLTGTATFVATTHLIQLSNICCYILLWRAQQQPQHGSAFRCPTTTAA